MIIFDFTDPVQYVKGVGPKRLSLFEKLGVRSVSDLLRYYPREYQDRRNIKPIAKAIIGNVETIKGTVKDFSIARPHGRKSMEILKFLVSDGHSYVYWVWFNQSYMKDYVKKGDEVIITGRVSSKFHELQIEGSWENFEIISGDADDGIHTGRIVPIYNLTAGLSQKVLRKCVRDAVDRYCPEIIDHMPENVVFANKLMDYQTALEKIHFPDEVQSSEKARERLIFDEFMLFELAVLLKKRHDESWSGKKPREAKGDMTGRLLGILPFELTLAQRNVINEILGDMCVKKCMNRLLQGDVGCGKTIVSVIAMLTAVENGYQCVMMVPTELLAEQHFFYMRNLLKSMEVEIRLLISSVQKTQREKIMGEIRDGKCDIVIGTHSVIQENVNFKNLGFVVIDEQHKFGVIQRSVLRTKGFSPDVLVMTATPIPRTLALTAYGDLDVSVIDEMPKGRQPVQTHWVYGKKSERVYEFIREQVEGGRQAFVVYPIIEESEKIDLKAAETMYKKLKATVFKGLSVGLIHGRLPRDEREETMDKFRKNEMSVLFGTTVIEVGVDVPNATVMLIEHAERFGLAQLHQLRGRIGRGKEKSYCILKTEGKVGDDAERRLNAMCRTCDGFRLAEEDLSIRGPGEFFGTRQHGVPNFLIADIANDSDLLELSRKSAEKIINEDAGLHKPENRLLKFAVAKCNRDVFDLAGIL